jgi:glycerophosphoryl diester phosphodiesterase
MHVTPLVESAFLRLADAVYRRLRQAVPDRQRLTNCRLIAHRGDYEHSGMPENSLAAFDSAVSGGVWGIEFDVRWTRDLQPIVIHDPDPRRVFGTGPSIQQTTYRTLRRTHPLIPHLEEVVQRFGGRVHLMVELKAERFPDPERQKRILDRIFSGLVPRDDFHFISLAPHVFDLVDFAPEHAMLPIAQVNTGAMSQLAATKGYGGLLGHYVMVTDSLVKMHKGLGQATGTGFADSTNCLFRELNRGVKWVFSNRAAVMQSAVEACLKHSGVRNPN